MKTTNEQIADAYLRRQTNLLQYASGLASRASSSLINTEKELYDAIILSVAKAGDNRTLTGKDGRKWQSDFLQMLQDTRSPAWDEINQLVTNEFLEVAATEAATTAAVIQAASPVILGMKLPQVSHLYAIVNSQPFEGHTLKNWLARTEQADVNRIGNAVKRGISQGQTPTEIARNIIGTQRRRYKDSVSRKAFNDMEALTLTIANGIQNEAKQQLYAANADVIDAEYFLNTLDIRTTIICISAGEKNTHGLGKGVYPRGVGPMPPLHFRCRSLRVPYINPDNWLNRGFDSSTEKEMLKEYTDKAGLPPVKSYGALPRGHKTKYKNFSQVRKRELVGELPAKTTYGEFLKNQTNEFQNIKLGKRKAELFRSGAIKIENFAASDGRIITVDELINSLD